MIKLLVFLLFCMCASAGAAAADPCEAVADGGPAPAGLARGATFSGTVVYIIDGDSLCVATGRGPESWVEVRLADFNANELHAAGGAAAKVALEAAAFGQHAECVAGDVIYDRIAAVCRIGGVSIGDLMRQAQVAEGGRGTRTPPGLTPFNAPGPSGRRQSAAGRRPAASVTNAPMTGAMFRSCAAARAAGAAPVHRGSPGYNPNLDGDHDGIACEPIRRP